MLSFELVKLGTVCSLQNGFAFKSELFEESGFPILRISNIQDNIIDTNKIVYTNIDSYKENLTKYIVEKDDLLIAMSGATTGKVGFNTTDTKFLLNQRVGKFIPKSTLSKQYLFYFLSTQVEKNLRISAGAAQPNLSSEQIKNMEIPLPPLPVQKAIVAKLDAAFASIEQAIAAAERNADNAKQLFQSYLSDVFERGGEGWVEKKLGDVCGFFNGYAFKSNDVIRNSDTQLLRMGNLYGNRLSLDRSPVFYPDKFQQTYSQYLISKGDIVMSLTGTVGKRDYGYAVMIEQISTQLLLNQRIAKIQNLNENLITKEFLLFYLRSEKFLDMLFKSANGTRQANLSTTTMKSLPIPLCSIVEQRTLLDKIGEIDTRTRDITIIAEKKRSLLEALKQSLLNQAFNGQLVDA